MDETKLKHGARDRREHYGLVGSIRHEDVAGQLAPANWIEKNPTTGFLTYPKRNQGLCEDCVDYSYAKALGVEILNIDGQWRECSPHSLYVFTFLPGGGSDSVQAGQMLCQQGMTLEILFPSDGITEAQAESTDGYANDAKQVALIYKPTQVIQCQTDFETIASILQSYQQQGKKKILMVTLIGQNNGTWYSTQPVPPSLPPDSTDPSLWYHKVPITDFGTINGKKVLAIDNSWGTEPGNGGQQFLTEAYAPYMYGGLYLQMS